MVTDDVIDAIYSKCNGETLYACLGVSRQWRFVGLSSPEWKRCCLDKWKLWHDDDLERPLPRRLDAGDWGERFAREVQVQHLVDKIVGGVEDRRKLVANVTSFMDVEALMRILATTPCNLTGRRYWARVTLESLWRGWIMKQWVRQCYLDRMEVGTSRSIVLSLEKMAIYASFLAETPTKIQDLHLLHKLDNIAQAVKPRLVGTKLSAKYNVLREYLFVSPHKFRPALVYDSIDNSIFSRVLKSEQGIPMTLSLVFAAVAEKCGLPAELMPFPRHVLVRLRDDNNAPVYFDVYSDVMMNAEDCRLFLHGIAPDIAWENQFLNVASSTIQVFNRMTANLQFARPPYGQRSESFRLMETCQRMVFAASDYGMDQHVDNLFNMIRHTPELAHSIYMPMVDFPAYTAMPKRTLLTHFAQFWHASVPTARVKQGSNPFQVGKVVKTPESYGVCVAWVDPSLQHAIATVMDPTRDRFTSVSQSDNPVVRNVGPDDYDMVRACVEKFPSFGRFFTSFSEHNLELSSDLKREYPEA